MTGGMAEAVKLIRGGQRFLLTCHVLPDPDAVGSMLGLAEILRSLGKEVVLYNRDRVPGPARRSCRASRRVARAFRRASASTRC